MDTFKDQENAEIKELCSKSKCELTNVPHNSANKFQFLDITINQFLINSTHDAEILNT